MRHPLKSGVLAFDLAAPVVSLVAQASGRNGTTTQGAGVPGSMGIRGSTKHAAFILMHGIHPSKTPGAWPRIET